MSKISFITPQPYHAIYQNRLVYDELEKRGWKLQYNEVDETTDYIFATSNSQFKKGWELSVQYQKPLILWVADISEQSKYDIGDYILRAWKVISICTKMQWETIRLTGRYRVDLVRPCIDNHTIQSSLACEPISKKNQIVVVGAMHPWKKPHIPFLAWKELPEPRPKLIYLTYGHLNEPIEGDYNKSTMAINGLFAPQLIEEAKGYDVEFKAVGDEEKYKTIAESKLLICADSFGGFNLPPIEAYFCNTPALVSDAHWFSDIDSRQFKTNDLLDLTEQLNVWLNLKLFMNKTDRMKQYTIEACANRLETKFNEWDITK